MWDGFSHVVKVAAAAAAAAPYTTTRWIYYRSATCSRNAALVSPAHRERAPLCCGCGAVSLHSGDGVKHINTFACGVSYNEYITTYTKIIICFLYMYRATHIFNSYRCATSANAKMMRVQKKKGHMNTHTQCCIIYHICHHLQGHDHIFVYHISTNLTCVFSLVFRSVFQTKLSMRKIHFSAYTIYIYFCVCVHLCTYLPR